jgi:CRISPR-associated endonuclease/helicase Cas3
MTSCTDDGSGAERLSAPARCVWAKSHTDPSQGLVLTGWLPLHQHLDDTAAIAGHLWDEWVPRSVKTMLSATFGGDLAARSLLVWLAGVHDVGKASPAFAVQVPLLASIMEDAGLPIDPRIAGSEERRSTRHELVSFLAIRDWLLETHRFGRAQASLIASVAAAHHGRPPTDQNIVDAEPLEHLVGDRAWRGVRREFLARADAWHAESGAIDSWRTADIQQPALVILSALVIIADWLASSDEFPLAPIGAQPIETASDRATRAWAYLRFPRPWQAHPESTDAATLLAERFALPPGATPHPTQAAMVEQALRVPRPELLILEAEMGSGKTEAALLAAEILAARFGMSGIFVGLPTQATTDAMFSRLLKWTERLGLDAPSTVYLARGKSQLNPEFGRLTAAAFRSIDREDAGHAPSDSLLIAHRWFSEPRRGPLSTFVAGTVDQALFAGLRSRYVMLRHLAFASKVVIIDEAHAYDEYMEQFLTRILEWLGAYGAPVILLSATLPSGRRREFLEAYDRGRDALRAVVDDTDMPRGERKARREAEEQRHEQRYARIRGDVGYPLITVTDAAGAPRVARPAAAGPARRVEITRLDDEPAALVSLLHGALREGGNVAVIRNTVRRAQETASVLRDELTDIPVSLAHSRFLGLDRARKDRELLGLYGRAGARPSTSVVVATQVLEQSLDVDFDLIVTDIAPIDLLLQRSGRLHRHRERERPGPLRAARLVITGADAATVPPEPDRGTLHVYDRAVLLRTLGVLENRSSFLVPDEIPQLVEAVYDPRLTVVPDAWQSALAAAEKVRDERERERVRRAGSFALGRIRSTSVSLLGWITAPDADPELTPPGRATVRDGEETLEVIVVQRGADGIVRTPAWLAEGAGIQLPDNEAPNGALARTLLGCALRLPAGMCHGNALDRHIAELERRFEFPTWQASHALRGELALVLDEDGRGILNEFDLQYSPDDGLSYADRSRTRQ